jgi:non-ribosomal peptide synthetase component F
VWEISIALVAGAALHVVTDEERRLGAGFAALLERDRPTWATLPPSLLRNLDPRDFPELRTLISAGEACDADIVRRWSAGRDFHNAYGPSETSICATRVRYRDSSETPSIGAAIANMQVYVLDADLRPLPPGVPGEIWIGGYFIFYLNKDVFEENLIDLVISEI